ncbi:MAG: LON peptidase substrate-binding domain-containing protein [Gammaproteobacteria bacterium]|nr:LON peptidase substrate-binding domain-containing protein [Gammaproteobacteria bacterium]
MTTLSIPIFPLHTVLFPRGALPLRIFEPRYLDMISTCMKGGSGFGICLIREGSEVGKAADTYEIGTLSEISYFNMDASGMLCITAQGKQRFHILSKSVQPNQLTVADVELLPNETEQKIPGAYLPAVEILRKLLDQLGYPFARLEKHYEDAGWVSGRLAELLPLRLEHKQYLLQMHDPLQRLERLWQLMEELELR